jgi:hypothetical protein
MSQSLQSIMGATETLRSSKIADLSTEMPVLRAFTMLGVLRDSFELADILDVRLLQK